MDNNFLIDSLLVDPITKEPLELDNTTNSLVGSDSGNRYLIIESVPQILPNEYCSTAEPNFHQTHGTDFKYVDHYQKDADQFDYFKENVARTTIDEYNRLHESILEEVTEEMSIILDIGCGNGWVSRMLVPKGKKVISMDISSTNPIKAIKRIPHKNHAGLIADIYHIPIKENSIDCIIASEILEHVPFPDKFIENSIKLLKNGGKLILTTPYDEKIEYSLCVHCNKPTPRFAHLHSFNEKNMAQLIPETGNTWKYKIFINSYLIRIRSYAILSFLPFKLWKHIDKVFNKLFYKPTRLQVVIKKL